MPSGCAKRALEVCPPGAPHVANPGFVDTRCELPISSRPFGRKNKVERALWSWDAFPPLSSPSSRSHTHLRVWWCNLVIILVVWPRAAFYATVVPNKPSNVHRQNVGYLVHFCVYCVITRSWKCPSLHQFNTFSVDKVDFLVQHITSQLYDSSAFAFVHRIITVQFHDTKCMVTFWVWNRVGLRSLHSLYFWIYNNLAKQ